MGADALSLAVERGVLTSEQRDALYRLDAEQGHVGADRARAGPRDPENLRFVGGFADVFVTIGIALFLWAVGRLSDVPGAAHASWLSVAVASWLLAEYFTRVRRMALPSIVLLLAFAVSSFMAVQAATSDFTPLLGLLTMSAVPESAVSFALAGAATAALSALHFWRFRVPITVAAGAAALVALAGGLLFAAVPGFAREWTSAFLLLAGLLVFTAAMAFDLSDPERLTRRTDIAFWLHLLAAPLIVRAVLPEIAGDTSIASLAFPIGGLDTEAALLVLTAFALIGAVSVAIDRRALLVSGLSYAGAAFWQVLRVSGLDEGLVPPLTFLALGSFILLLSVGWRPLRRLLLSGLPEPLTRRLPSRDSYSQA